MANLRAHRKTLQGLLDEIVREVDSLPLPVLRELYPVVVQAERELGRHLSDWLATAPDGAERFTAQHYRVALTQVEKARERIEQLDPALAGALADSDVRAAKLASVHVQRELVEFAAKFSHSMNPIPLLNAADLVGARATLLERYSRHNYSEAIMKDIRLQLARGVVQQETFDQLTRRLLKTPAAANTLNAGAPIAEKLFQKYWYWGERIVRTEVLESYNAHAAAGIAEAASYDDTIVQRWDASLDRRVCVICAQLHGEVRRVGENFTGGVDHPPAHPNCYVPGTEIQGAIVGALKARYSGDVVEITTVGGRRLTVTPNHPILTPNGFVSAGELCEGADLFAYVGDTVGSASVNPHIDEQHNPTRVEEIFRTLADRGASTFISPSAGDLHGDAFFVQGDVEVIQPNRQLLHNTEGFSKIGSNFVLKQPHLAESFEASARSPHPGLCRLHAAATFVPGSTELSFNRSAVELQGGPFQALCFGLGAQLDVSRYQDAGESTTTDVELLRQLQERCSAVIQSDKISKIRKFNFSGHVYDVQTLQGVTIAQNIVTSNCRCAVIAWREGWKLTGENNATGK